MRERTGREMTLSDYYDKFEVDEKAINDVMVRALSRGGDYCDLYFQHGVTDHIGLEDNAVNRAQATAVMGVGVRVLKGGQTGYSFTEELSKNAMMSAAETAANIADSGKTVEPVRLELKKIPNHYPVETEWESVPIQDKIPFLQQINEKIFDLDHRVIKSVIHLGNASSYILQANSDGKIVCDYRPMIHVAVSCTAEWKNRREQNFHVLSARMGGEFLTPERIDVLAKKTVLRTVRLFEAVKPEAGEMEVVLAAGRSGILLHEAIGHGMEADFNRKKVSIFCDKMDKRVAENFVTIVDDGTNPNARGSLNVDDEGNDVEKTLLVENGILRNYLHDRISADHYKVEPTGNGRRQSFRYAPQPRMRNTYMEPGPHKKEEIIKSVKKGLYAETFSNGQVLIGGGDFTFYVKNGWLIEDGELTRPVKDVNIIGNGPEVLRNIVMVGDDLKLAEGGGTCGKNGQSVPVSLGLPTVKVSKITVGGVDSKRKK